MRRRLKRRGRSVDRQGSYESDDKVSVSSPPRLRRDSINKTSSKEFAFNLERAAAAQVVDADDSGGGTISTVTNDVAFREDVFKCGFDNTEYGVMKSKDAGKLQPQTDGKEYRINRKGSTTKTSQESPMGVNQIDFPYEFDLRSNNKESKAIEGQYSSKLNLGRNLKKDDDTFFYSASAPSDATSDTRLVGETITLGSTSSYLHSFDILDNGQKKSTTRPGDAYLMGMGRGSPIRELPPRDSLQTRETKKVHTAAEAVAAAPSAPLPSPPPPPPQAPPQRGTKPIEKADAPNNDDPTKAECSVPEILQEFVGDVKSVLNQVMTVAYWACTEGEQCLSRCQSDEPEPKPQQTSQLNTIVSDSTMPAPNSQSAARADESGSKPWSGDYLGPRTGTEETADNSNSSQEGDGTAEERQGLRTTHRLKKFLTSFKTRK